VAGKRTDGGILCLRLTLVQSDSANAWTISPSTTSLGWLPSTKKATVTDECLTLLTKEVSERHEGQRERGFDDDKTFASGLGVYLAADRGISFVATANSIGG
jgi:hypothetical protein